MPEISRFFGIIIYMNWREHPPKHFHAVYGDYEALITLDGAVYAGELPRRALSLVREWLAIRRCSTLPVNTPSCEPWYGRMGLTWHRNSCLI